MRVLAAFVLSTFVLGCGATVRSASAGAAEAATQAAVVTLEDPETRARVGAVLASPEMQRAMRELSAEVSQGVIDGLTDEERDARVQRLVATITAATMRSAAGQISDTLAPAIRKAIVEEMGPGLGDALKAPAFKAAMAELSYDVARAAVMGSNEALAELAEKQRRDEGGAPLGTIGAFVAPRGWMLGALVATLILGAPLAWLWREHRRLKRRVNDQSFFAPAATQDCTAAAAAGLGASLSSGMPPPSQARGD
ncbi:MAG: hypothetical protein KF819_15190 [Labilithrix sp.]|nr:hypothetical protein [Labilithrix sp.]